MDFQKITYLTQNTKYVFANPGTTVYLTGNYKFGSYFYVGANVGLFFVSNSNLSVYPKNSKVPELVYTEPGTGVAAGIQLGYSYPLSSKLKLNAEFGSRISSYNIDYENTNNTGQVTKGSDKYSYISGYISIGLRLLLFNDPFNQWLPYKRVD
jgi:hypothetical protein